MSVFGQPVEHCAVAGTIFGNYRSFPLLSSCRTGHAVRINPNKLESSNSESDTD